MMRSTKTLKPIFCFSLFLLLLQLPCHFSLPLSTNKRWIVDAKTGRRVKLACVSWPSHIDTMLAEGLQEKPLRYIASHIAKEQFNCVRFTWATYMFTRDEYGGQTVEQSFDRLNLTEAKAGIHKHNRFLLSKTLREAYDIVVDELGRHNLMVIVDNHVAKPSWCCHDKDGNGFWGDTYLHFEEWLRGVTYVANHFKGKRQVIAIGMKNEPHGPHSNVDDWYKYMTEGVKRVHKANPDLLIFVSGLRYATDFTFLKTRPWNVELDNKLVYEPHWYSWDDVWLHKELNRVCHDKTQGFINSSAFMNSGENPVPIFLGEFGLDVRMYNVRDDHFLSCLLAFFTDQDLDFGLWSLQGSYYIRDNKTGMEETYGVLDYHWNRIKNPTVQSRFQLIKRVNQDPTSQILTTYIMFHPQSGSCIRAYGKEEIYATECKSHFSQWSYEGDGSPLRLEGTELCLKAVGDGIAPVLSTDCTSKRSTWTRLSETKLHLAAQDENGQYLCLHKESPQTFRILTSKCLLTEDDRTCERDTRKDVTTQWFKLVPTNV